MTDDTPDAPIRGARKIKLTPALTAVAQDADEAGLGFTALLTADVSRGRLLARRAWLALPLRPEHRQALRRALDGVEMHDIISGLDDLPSAERVYAETVDAGQPEAARAWLDALPGPLAVWGLLTAARRG